jgi:outer membrane protein
MIYVINRPQIDLVPLPRSRRFPLVGAALLSLLLLLGAPLSLQAEEPELKLTEKGAIAIALKQHPSVKEYWERAESNRYQIGVSQSGYYPQVTSSMNYFYGNAFIKGPSGGVSPTITPAGVATSLGTQPTDLWIYRFNINQLIYDFGKTPGTVAGAKATYGQSKEDYANTRETVVLNVRTAYFGYLAAQRARTVSQESVHQNQELLKQAQGFYQVGIRAKIDVTKAEANLYNAEADLIRAKNAVEIARVNLMNALGVKTWTFSGMEEKLEVTPRLLSLNELKRNALEQRPEMLKNRYQQDAGEANLKVARSGFFPTLSSTASYGWQGETYPLKDNWWVGVGITIPIFEGFINAYSVQSAKAQIRATQANAEVLRQDISKEVDQSYLDLKAAWDVIRATTKALEAARENFRLAQGRYKVGVGSIIEVTDAQVQLFQADLRNVQAMFDYRTAEARLDKAIGLAF